MRTLRHDVNPAIWRSAVVAVLAAAALILSLQSVGARSGGPPPNPIAYCDAPVVIPLTGAGDSGAADGVVLARGATIAERDDEAVVRLGEPGSRVQVSLGQPLLHTQWVFGQVDRDDSVRVDAIADGALQPLTSVSTFGSFVAGADDSIRGWTAGGTGDGGPAQIDVHVPADVFLFSNDGSSAVELVAAVGCPALTIDADVQSSPTWDEETQRFVGLYRVSMRNNLPTRDALAALAASWGDGRRVPRAATSVDEIVLDLDIASPGFSSAAVTSQSAPILFRPIVDPLFDGFTNTRLFTEPRTLSSTLTQSFVFEIAFVPDLDDPIWQEGMRPPAPRFVVESTVDGVPSSQIVTFAPSRPSLSAGLVPESLAERGFEPPVPALAVRHLRAQAPQNRPDGSIVVSELVVIANSGEADLVGVEAGYDLVEMYGPGTRVVAATAIGTDSCSGQSDAGYDGGRTLARIVALDGVLEVGESCSVSIRATIVPGEVPSQGGSEYRAPIVATGRSGVLTTAGRLSVSSLIRQEVSLDASVSELNVDNSRDGTYVVSGTVELTNSGDQFVNGVDLTLDVGRTGADGRREPRAVRLSTLDASGPKCVAGPVPADQRTGFLLLSSSGAAIDPGDHCSFEFSFVARPGSALTGWTVSASSAGAGPRGQSATAIAESTPVDLPEAPEIDTLTTVTDPVNNGDGTFELQVEHTVTNSGDVPLVSIELGSDLAGFPVSQLLDYRVLEDTCGAVSDRTPLMPDGSETSCRQRRLAILQPGSLFRDRRARTSAVGASTSGAATSADSRTEPFTFLSSPALTASLALDSIAKSSTGGFELDFGIELANTGDVVLAGVNGELDLTTMLRGMPYQVRSLTSTDLTIDANYDGRDSLLLLTGSDSIPVNGVRSIDLVVAIESADEAGPMEFGLRAWGVAPSRQIASWRTPPLVVGLPILAIAERNLTQRNNSDGSYEVTEVLVVENVGASELGSVDLVSDFDDVFEPIATTPSSATDQCTGASLSEGQSCRISHTRTVRPGLTVGPYRTAISIGARTDAGLEAVVLAESSPSPSDGLAGPGVVFLEEPVVRADATVGEVLNHGDGTYSFTYAVDVTNAGDVPLYAVDVPDAPSELFGDRVVDADRAVDTCSVVSEGSPMAPGESCRVEQLQRVRPAERLGPWNVDFEISASTPAGSEIGTVVEAPGLTFTELIDADIGISWQLAENNGDGSYDVAALMKVENRSDVPIVAMTVDPGFSTLTDRLVSTESVYDTCSRLSLTRPLAPEETCEQRYDLLIRPGPDLGPWIVDAQADVTSASNSVESFSVPSNELILPESPAISIDAAVASVENNGDGSFRVVAELAVANTGDVRLDDVQVELDLDEAFGSADHQVEGLLGRELDVSTAFVAAGSSELLEPGLSLDAGSSGTATIVLRVTPGDQVGPFTTTATSAATAPSSAVANADATLVIDLPAIAVTVTEQTAENNGDGSYLVSTTYELVNRGTTRLDDVRLVEDIRSIFPTAEVVRTNVTSADLTTTQLGATASGNDLIAPGNALEVGASAEVRTEAVVVPGIALGPFRTEVVALGMSPAGTDVATPGAGTDLVFVESPALRVSQRLAERPVWNGDGKFDVTFAIDVVNDGDVELRDVQIREDLLQALGADTSIEVHRITSTALTPNPAFDGMGVPPADPSDAPGVENGLTPPNDVGDTRILGGWDTLPAGASASVELELSITPGSSGVFNTRVVASALSPGGQDIGTRDEIEATTLTRLTVEGELGLAKRVLGEPRVRADGAVEVSYEILVENAGPLPLSNVEIHDQLSQAFGIGSSFATSGVRTEPDAPCDGFASSTFDGGTVDPVLVSGFALAPAQTCRIQYDAVVTPQKPFPGPFRSSAFALASDPFGSVVVDDSTDGSNPDPDGNQEPGDNDVATEVRVEAPPPEVGVAVAVTDLIADGEWFEITYRAQVSNPGSIDLVAPRVAADLRAQWGHEFRVIDLWSEDLAVNRDFDGDRDVRLVSSRNELPAGDEAVIEFVVAARVGREDTIDLELTFDATSVAGDSTAVLGVTATAVESVPMDESTGGDWSFAELSGGERWMLLLGAAALATIAAFGIRSVVSQWRELRRLRSYFGRRAIIDRHVRRWENDWRDRSRHHANHLNGHHKRRRRTAERHTDESTDDETSVR